MIPVYMNNEQLYNGRSSKNYRISTSNNTKRIYSLVKMVTKHNHSLLNKNDTMLERVVGSTRFL